MYAAAVVLGIEGHPKRFLGWVGLTVRVKAPSGRYTKTNSTVLFSIRNLVMRRADRRRFLLSILGRKRRPLCVHCMGKYIYNMEGKLLLEFPRIIELMSRIAEGPTKIPFSDTSLSR